jgi:uncharacterized protein YjbI with pentapeptide repeats
VITRTSLVLLSALILGVVVVVWLRSSDIRLRTATDWVSAQSSIITQLLPELLLVLGLLVILLLWKLPKRQAAQSQGLTAENRFERENEARKTLAQIIGGVFLLAGLYSSTQSFTLQREGQITDRFTKAIEQLGAVDTEGRPKLEVRLGAIYALERIARDSERDHWPIMEVLMAYVRREPSPSKDAAQIGKQAIGTKAHPIENPDPRPLRADYMAILTVITRRDQNHDPLYKRVDLSWADFSGAKISGDIDLSHADLRHANLSHSDLSSLTLREVSLYQADLRGASFFGGDLSGSWLSQADLSDAWLYDVNLRKADLSGAHLSGTRLDRADLSDANLDGSHLSRVDFREAHLNRTYLRRVNLSDAELEDADFSDAIFDETDVSGADLRGAKGLTQRQLNNARGNNSTKLPDNFKRPDTWHDQENP